MKRSSIRSSGFTLIELMIVFVIIIVLAGMVLRLMGLAGTRNAEAVTRERLERVAQALEEFRATYGRYPPVDYYPGGSQPVEYEFPGQENSRAMPSDIASILVQRSRNKNIWSEDGSGRVFTFGLMSYFFPRYKGHAELTDRKLVARKTNKKSDEKNPFNQWSDYNEFNPDEDIADIVQNIESSRRILPYLGASLRPDGSVEKYGIVTKDYVRRYVDSQKSGGQSYLNTQLFILDGWSRYIHYQSRPPYDSYRLWSNGADGRAGTDDDIVVGEG